MAWNEPDEDNRDPWRGRKTPKGAPDLDDLLRKLQEKLGQIFGDGGRKRGRNEPGIPPRSSGVLWGLLVALLIVWLGSDSFYRIEPAERGVVRRFGSFVDILEPGPHFRLPRPIEYVSKVNVDAVKDFTVMATMLTGDENIVDVEVVSQYRVRDPDKYIFNTADPDDTVRQVTESSIREIIGMSAFDFVITEGRSEIATQAQRRMQENLDQYNAGIEITSVNMQPVKPPDEVKAAFDDAIKAREDEHRKTNEAEAYRNEVIERAQGEAERLRLEAAAYREEKVSRATGEASRFEQVLAQYRKAPSVTRKRLYLESIESVLNNTAKVVVDTNKSGNITYLPLDRLLSAPEGSSRAVREATPQVSTTVIQAPASRVPDGRAREAR